MMMMMMMMMTMTMTMTMTMKMMMLTFSWCIVRGWQRHSRVENLGWTGSSCKADRLMPRIDYDDEDKNGNDGDEVAQK